MSQKKDKDETEKNEMGKEKKEEAEAGTSKEEPEKSSGKKEKRIIRFQLPPGESICSEESFTSAMSSGLADDNNEVTIPTPPEYVPVLKKNISTPALIRSQPRTISAGPCFHILANEVIFAKDDFLHPSLSTTSSKQLFEVTMESPILSDVNIELISSTSLRRLDKVEEAVRSGADVNTIKEGQTPLLIASEVGDHRLVAYFLTVPKVNPDIRNAFGQTPLIIAVRNAFDNIVGLLLSHNADVNIADNMGRTPLHGALYQNRVHIIRLLLAYGADYEKQDCFGETPMYTVAVKKPHLESLKILLKIGASVNFLNVSGVPLLSRAILNETNFDIIETLVQYGASVNATDLNTRKGPLHFAAITNNIRIAKFLVSHGASTNSKTFYNFTPFDEALVHRSLDVAEFLSNKTNKTSLKLFHLIRNIKPI